MSLPIRAHTNQVTTWVLVYRDGCSIRLVTYSDTPDTIEFKTFQEAIAHLNKVNEWTVKNFSVDQCIRGYPVELPFQHMEMTDDDE